MSPSAASRELFLAAKACPRSLSTRRAPSRSPPDSSSAFLTSIMPAAVSSRSCFIFSIVLAKLLSLLVLSRRRLLGALGLGFVLLGGLGLLCRCVRIGTAPGSGGFGLVDLGLWTGLRLRGLGRRRVGRRRVGRGLGFGGLGVGHRLLLRTAGFAGRHLVALRLRGRGASVGRLGFFLGHDRLGGLLGHLRLLDGRR